MGEHEGRCVERRLRTPPALPLGVLVPARRAELVRAHDLGPDPRAVLLGERVVDTAATARLIGVAPAPGGEHPFVQPLAGMAERCLPALRLTGAEAVERDGEVVDARE